MTHRQIKRKMPAFRLMYRRHLKVSNTQHNPTEYKRIADVYYTARQINKLQYLPFNVNVDHIKPISHGGKHTYNNIQIVSEHDNFDKADNDYKIAISYGLVETDDRTFIVITNDGCD